MTAFRMTRPWLGLVGLLACLAGSAALLAPAADHRAGQNLPVAGGGMFRAAVQDDPFFFDAGQFSTFIAAGTAPFPRPVGQAHNFFGPNVNTLSFILELPTARIRSAPSNPNVGVFATT